MSTSPSTIVPTTEIGILHRLRNYAGAGIFMLIRRFPLLVKFQRSEQSWSVFRLVLGCAGAGLVVLPLGFWIGWVTGILAPLCGLLLFVASILLPPPEPESETDRKARELGASTMVSGGEYQPGNAPVAQARLFISSAHVWALDKNFDPLVVIPTPEISALSVNPAGEGWSLWIRWAEHKAEFVYSGIFAERYARLAEESIRGALPGAFSEPLKRRAATR